MSINRPKSPFASRRDQRRADQTRQRLLQRISLNNQTIQTYALIINIISTLELSPVGNNVTQTGQTSQQQQVEHQTQQASPSPLSNLVEIDLNLPPGNDSEEEREPENFNNLSRPPRGPQN